MAFWWVPDTIMHYLLKRRRNWCDVFTMLPSLVKHIDSTEDRKSLTFNKSQSMCNSVAAISKVSLDQPYIQTVCVKCILRSHRQLFILSCPAMTLNIFYSLYYCKLIAWGDLNCYCRKMKFSVWQQNWIPCKSLSLSASTRWGTQNIPKQSNDG